MTAVLRWLFRLYLLQFYLPVITDIKELENLALSGLEERRPNDAVLLRGNLALGFLLEFRRP
jgi:hypothetical protein